MQSRLLFEEDTIAENPYLEILKNYIPSKALSYTCEFLLHHKVELKITKKRSSKFGDYRTPFKGKSHIITINGDLNPFAFLITLVHEMAHLSCYVKHGTKRSVKPHGKEWKDEFKHHMIPFIQLKLFPQDVLKAVFDYIQNPGASSCSDEQLMRSLKKYDPKSELIFLEELPENSLFRIGEDRIFKKGPKQRKHYKCICLNNKRMYLVSPLAEVRKVEETII
ncbi:MAG: metallopeptidase [Bacteroidia bacterium]|nr:MAG: metallopeptidase [Bacteroidia bacterium]